MSVFRYASAAAGDLPCLSIAPYPASTFQRALPEVAGFGVTTLTPGLVRSLQVVMCLGLPLRTTKTTTESLENPCSGLAAQLEATILSPTSRVMSGVVENATTSAGWPESTARLCEPEEPNEPA